jgi:hypothetical protein
VYAAIQFRCESARCMLQHGACCNTVHAATRCMLQHGACCNTVHAVSDRLILLVLFHVGVRSDGPTANRFPLHHPTSFMHFNTLRTFNTHQHSRAPLHTLQHSRTSLRNPRNSTWTKRPGFGAVQRSQGHQPRFCDADGSMCGKNPGVTGV